jgi:hypothetical protein
MTIESGAGAAPSIPMFKQFHSRLGFAFIGMLLVDKAGNSVCPVAWDSTTAPVTQLCEYRPIRTNNGTSHEENFLLAEGVEPDPRTSEPDALTRNNVGADAKKIEPKGGRTLASCDSRT